jgi:ABC-type Fe3+-hydroxamate transport system substrate-binding protein
MILTSVNELHKPAKRIISLVPSQTELLHYLALEEETAGITKFCIHPATWFQNKNRVGGTKNVDIQLIKEINPGLVIANKEENVREQVEELARDFPVWVTDVNNLDDALEMITDIGTLTGKIPEARQLSDRIRENFSSLHNSPPIPVCYLIWKDPYMVAASGTFIDDMILSAGFRNVFAGRKRYPVVTLDEIREATPKIILLSSEPYPFAEKHLLELKHFLPGITPLLADGEMFSWYGSRLLQAPAYFKKLHAEAMSVIDS